MRYIIKLVRNLADGILEFERPSNAIRASFHGWQSAKWRRFVASLVHGIVST